MIDEPFHIWIIVVFNSMVQLSNTEENRDQMTRRLQKRLFLLNEVLNDMMYPPVFGIDHRGRRFLIWIWQ